MENLRKQIKSVRGKLFFTLCAVIIAIILFLIIVNSVVLEKYYQFAKSNTLKAVYNQINAYYNGELKIGNLSEELNAIAIKNNFDIIIKDEQDVAVYLSGKDFLSNIKMITEFWGVNRNREYQIIEENQDKNIIFVSYISCPVYVYLSFSLQHKSNDINFCLNRIPVTIGNRPLFDAFPIYSLWRCYRSIDNSFT